MLNKYFNNYGYGREQDLIEDLILESIKIYGHDVKYLPRTIVKEDDLFGEDILSKFEEAISVEMFLKSMEGFEGDGQFLAKFGLEIRDQIVLTVARKRFDQVVTSPKLMTEVGYNLIFEDGSTQSPSRQFLTGSKDTQSMMDEGIDYLNNINRPQEGDLIYFPMVGKIFEIMYVDDKPTHFQMGRMQSYDLRCELFEYSSERIDTGDVDIDLIEDVNSLNVLDNQFTLEDDAGVLKNEDGNTVLQEFAIESVVPDADNTFLDVQGESILDFSEGNPFSEVDRY
jgi:hypothetical protein|tara:strand:- start:186 stop:1034 length:849 start_codon:yes stop_codon:yes gene_type:complete